MSIERNWHPNFIKYMDFIINHPNYKGLPIKQSENSYGWIAPAKGEIGKQRKEWANKKAQENQNRTRMLSKSNVHNSSY